MPGNNGQGAIVYHHRTQGVDAQGIHVHEMCRAFESLGYKVNKVALHATEEVGKESRPGVLGRMISRMPGLVYELLELGYNLVGIPRLYKSVVAHRPLFIYERYSLFNLCGAVVSGLTGVPLVLEVNSPLAMERSRHGGLVLKRLAQRLETLVASHATRVIVVSGVLGRMLAGNGAKAERIVVMHNGVNLEEFASLPRPPDSVEGSVTVGFTGWFRPWHCLSEMLTALDDNGIFGLGVNVLLVGDGPGRAGLEEIIAERGLEHCVSITGAADRKSLFGYLARMDVALQPAATHYASPMKLIEYLAAAKAVVAPDQDNIRELVHDRENALLFTPGDWDGLARRVRELVLDSGLRLRLGQAARRSVVDNGRTWQANAARVAAMMAERVT